MRAGTPAKASQAFQPAEWQVPADLFALGRQALDQAGVSLIYGGHDCTFIDPARCYSFRAIDEGRHRRLLAV